MELGLAIYTLEAAARRRINVVTVGTKKLHRVVTWHVCSTAGDYIAPSAVHTRARSEYTALVFINLGSNYNQCAFCFIEMRVSYNHHCL